MGLGALGLLLVGWRSRLPALRAGRFVSSDLVPFLALWLGLLGLSAILIFSALPVAAPNPLLAVAIAALAGPVGLALLYLGTLRFLVLGRPSDLCAGAAFGTLALTNLVVRTIAPISGATPAPAETSLSLILMLRGLAAGLFVGGLLYGGAAVVRAQRRAVVLMLGGALVALIGVGVAGILAAGDRLPPAVSPGTRQLLEADAVILDVMPGQAAWLLAANGLTGVVMLLAALGYGARAGRRQDPYDRVLAAALALLTFGHFHAVLAPPVAIDYVSTADGFRLAAYLLLLIALVASAGRDIAARAAGEERLRLSHELHDGLMQQLGLLNLRLGRAADPARSAARRDRDLTAARQVLEAAMLEARQAITALRSGTVSWQELQGALERFADEFGRNHEVDVDLNLQGPSCPLPARLQADLLRIVHEASSNAVRHGGAGRIEIVLAGSSERLKLRIQDDGRGFDPATVAGGGLGLRSMAERAERWGGNCAVEAAPGQGTVVRATFRLGPPRGPV